MMGLWADGWFYISSAGLLISGILFFFLLGQYRVASEAADATEEHAAEKEASVPDVAVRPVYIPDEAPAAKVASHSEAPEPKPEPKPEAKPKVEEAPVERRRDPSTSTGGISPAVVYLQNIKVELADLHKDLRALSKRVDDELSSVSTRDEALIERLGELTRAVEGLKAAAPAADEETPKPARKPRKAEKAPEPEPAPEIVVEAAKPAEEVSIEVLPPPPVDEPLPLPEPAAQAQAPAPAKTFSPDETIRMELGAIIAPPAAVEAPAAAEPPQPAQEAPPAEEKPRRGPVWPV